jgi:hypothetical protein
MRFTHLVVALALVGGCKKKQNTGETTGSGSAMMVASGATDMAGSAAVAGSAGSAAPGSAATAGSAAADGSAAQGSASTLDPKYAAMDAQERHTCGAYATCKVDEAKTDDPKAVVDENPFLNGCLDVWTTMKADAKAKVAKCADKAGACDGVLPCFDSMKIKSR